MAAANARSGARRGRGAGLGSGLGGGGAQGAMGWLVDDWISIPIDCLSEQGLSQPISEPPRDPPKPGRTGPAGAGSVCTGAGRGAHGRWWPPSRRGRRWGRSRLALLEVEGFLKDLVDADRIAPVGSAAVGKPVHGLAQAVVGRDQIPQHPGHHVRPLDLLLLQ